MLLTKNAMYALLKRIAETGGMTEDMEKDFQRLKDDFDEREGILKKYGEEYDGEKDEYEYIEKEYNKPSDLDSERDVDYWRNQAENYRKRYIDRFFGGDESLIAEEKERSTEEFIETEENEVETYDELLRKDDE